MIWIGTSGWVFPHWQGRFYPPELPEAELLAYYARHFSTVEINRSFYRQPSREQFAAWARQAVAVHPGFRFAVKASRYLTHLKKLLDTGSGISRLMDAVGGLGAALGPLLFQLPPRWHSNAERLERFIAALPSGYLYAFEFREPSWYQPDILRILEHHGCALVIPIAGSDQAPRSLPTLGPFAYLRFHWGAHGTGFGDEELRFWAERMTTMAAAGRDVYAYFNNDPDGHAIADAQRLRSLLEGKVALAP
jgi:uncharacterized protein YecE (DUF72 family)